MIYAAFIPIIRRAILDLLHDIGGEHSDQELTLLLNELGHRVARRDVASELRWLAEQQFITLEECKPLLVAEILPDGSDIAEGRLRDDNISRHRTGR